MFYKFVFFNVIEILQVSLKNRNIIFIYILIFGIQLYDYIYLKRRLGDKIRLVGLGRKEWGFGFNDFLKLFSLGLGRGFVLDFFIMICVLIFVFFKG